MKTSCNDLKKLAVRLTKETTLDLNSQLKALLDNHTFSEESRGRVLKVMYELPYLIDELYILELDYYHDNTEGEL